MQDEATINNAVRITGNPRPGDAMSLRPDGSVGPLIAGEVFFGLAFLQFRPRSTASVETGCDCVLHQGVTNLSVGEGVKESDVGKAVFATGPSSFTFEKSGGSHVGKVIGYAAPNRAVVKFSV